MSKTVAGINVTLIGRGGSMLGGKSFGCGRYCINSSGRSAQIVFSALGRRFPGVVGIDPESGLAIAERAGVPRYYVRVSLTPGLLLTLCWREPDSNHQYRGT